jgi:LacI family transcriptional regulator
MIRLSFLGKGFQWALVSTDLNGFNESWQYADDVSSARYDRCSTVRLGIAGNAAPEAMISDIGIAAVARRAGVSVGTVSNYFNRPQVVAERTARRVQTAIDELGYVRNSSARDLRVGRSRSIGLLVLDIGNPFFTDFVDGAEEVAASNGLTVMFGSSKESAAKESSYLETFQEQRVAGLILAPVGDVQSRLEALRREGTPTVLIDDGSDIGDFCSVAVDDRRGGKLATGHLGELGRTDVLITSGPEHIHQVRARLEGALSEAQRRGMMATIIHAEAYTTAAARSAIGAHIDSNPDHRFDAVFAANDLMAVGAMLALHDRGRSVPHDVAIVGYDDIPYAEALSPTLSSVRQPSREMGIEAMTLLLEEISGSTTHAHHRTLFKPSLHARESSQRSH